MKGAAAFEVAREGVVAVVRVNGYLVAHGDCAHGRIKRGDIPMLLRTPLAIAGE